MTEEKDIQAVFEGVPYELIHEEHVPEHVSSLEFASNKVQEGALFFCVPGTTVDGHKFGADAVSRGASALVVDHPLDLEAAQFIVEDTRAALALCSANFYGQPSHELSVVGITGTNGKTTTTFLVEHIIRSAKRKAGLIGTVECHIDDEVVPSAHTTPESRDFQELLARMVDAGVDVCVCEVSSHALDLGRVKGTRFDVAAFSNLTQDHLDYHKTLDAYFEAKAKLFTEYEPAHCVICTDSDAGRKLSQRVCGSSELVCVGTSPDCDIRVVDARYSDSFTHVDIDVAGEVCSFDFPLVGRFNIENMLLAFGIGRALGYSIDTIIEALETAPQVPGRLEVVSGSASNPFSVLVDYAHTPDSIEKAISALRSVTDGRIICVFGCGGDRDHDKRPKMGRAALAADHAIVTSDNPRSEDPADIISMIVAGMDDESRFTVIEDRTEAIYHAIDMAEPGDVVLIAGKGHEDYQIIGTTKHHFDDREIAAQALDRCRR